ncbi:MAG: hypothetical protein KBT36_12055 [Kurthia sp.]|nr:hypothetical protein [Candidatus Kurthia equi]
MEIYSFSGPSGTGKSSYALEFAYQHAIEAIIDDGLLIINGDIKGGTSAKFEKIMIKAVKRAIFTDEEHVKEVKHALNELQPKKLLIIGTSDKMTNLIAKRLQVGEIKEYYHIENFRSRQQMKMARFVRKTEGKHIMPIPVNQIQQNFFKRLVLKGFEIFSTKREKIGETAIVQPDFHNDLVVFQKKDFIQCIRKSCEQSKSVSEVHKIHFSLYPLPKTTISITYNAKEVELLIEKTKQLQEKINEDFNACFEIEFERIHIEILHMV